MLQDHGKIIEFHENNLNLLKWKSGSVVHWKITEFGIRCINDQIHEKCMLSYTLLHDIQFLKPNRITSDL